MMTTLFSQEEYPTERSLAFNARRPTLVVAELYSGPQHMAPDFSLLQKQEEEMCSSDSNNQKSAKCFDTLLHRFAPQPLPDFHVLGRCALRVTNLPTTLHRICEFIKKCSLDFQVFPEDGRIDCRAPSLLSFSIWMWEGDNDNDDITIELQRRSGCGVLMQRYRRAFAGFVQSGQNFNADSLNCCARAMPPSRFFQAPPAGVAFAANKKESETLERCQSMMESESDEQKRLGMENLLLLLNSTCVASETVGKVAEAIVWEKKSYVHTTLLDELSFYFICNQRRRTKQNTMATTDACDFEQAEFAEGRKCGIMHHLALQVLATALSVVQRLANQQSTALDLSSAPWTTIIGSLCYNLNSAGSRPQEAALSAQCLFLLDSLSPNHDAVLAALRHSVHFLPSLFAAREFGATHNTRLCLEVRHLLGRIEEALL